MRILVAGSAGFIGYHLCARLLDDGHDEVLLSDGVATKTRLQEIFTIELYEK